MNCRICNDKCKPVYTLDNQPAGAQHLPETPDSGGITLNVAKCEGCGLIQLDNKPVWYWRESINSAHFSKELHIPKDSISFMELEHQPRPNEYLQKLGTGSIQVPDNKTLNPYNLILDHLSYFNTETLQFALEYNGLWVRSIETLFNVILSAQVVRHKHIGIYGASHQAFTWLAIHRMVNIDMVIDDNPIKQGKYTPATNIPINGTDALKDLDAVIVMAGGYSDEVLKKLDDFKGSVAVLRGNKLEVIR